MKAVSTNIAVRMAGSRPLFCFASYYNDRVSSFTRYRSFSTIGPNSVETLKRAKDRTQFISSCRALNFREVTKPPSRVIFAYNSRFKFSNARNEIIDRLFPIFIMERGIKKYFFVEFFFNQTMTFKWEKKRRKKYTDWYCVDWKFETVLNILNVLNYERNALNRNVSNCFK